MKKLTCLVAVGALFTTLLSTCQPQAAPTTSTGQAGTPCQLDAYGCGFMPQAGYAGLMEMTLGKIALQRATRPEVRSFAQQMIKEHSAIKEEYRPLMRRKGLVPPDTMLQAQRQKVDSLQHLPARQVDARYVAMMVADHAMAVQLFDEAYTHAQDADYKEWLARMRQIVRMHYQHALALRSGPAG
jgi:putative membrane protein